MNNTEEKSIKILQEKKIKIKEKENNILNSQIKQNVLENKIKRLESKKEKIINGKKGVVERITSHIIYSLIMISVLITFITQFIDIFEVTIALQKCIYITAIYVGVISISVLGTIISSKIEKSLSKYLNEKRITKMTKLIKGIEREIQLEVNKQEILKREITEIINKLDNIPIIESKEECNIDNYNINKIRNNVYRQKEEIIVKKRAKKI